MPMNKKMKKGGWVATAPMAACAIAFLAFVFVPGVKQFHAKSAELETKRAYIVQAGDQLVQLQKAESDLQATLAYNASWQSKVPDEPDLAALYKNLNGQCQAAGAGILRFEPKENSRYGQLAQVPLVLETQGSYTEIMDMLSGLDSVAAPLWVEGLHLEFARQSGQDATCAVTLAVFAEPVGNSN